jgi:hypothetical protein
MTRGITTLAALLALIPLLGACSAAGPGPAGTTAGPEDTLPPFGRTAPRAREPSSERPPWLPALPPNLPRYRVPDDGHRDNLA